MIEMTLGKLPNYFAKRKTVAHCTVENYRVLEKFRFVASVIFVDSFFSGHRFYFHESPIC